MRLAGGPAPLWIIDPIDGTDNFAHGRPGFAVILALLEPAAVRAGWLYDPLGERMVWAVPRRGAWSNGTRLDTVDASVPPARISGTAYGNAASGRARGQGAERQRRSRRHPQPELQRSRISRPRLGRDAFHAPFAFAALGSCRRHADTSE